MINNTDVQKLNYEKHLISLNAIAQQNQIVFIDSQVEDYQVLAAGVIPDIEVIKIDSDRDGVQQITEALSRIPYSKVHIVAHGAPGYLHLGNTNLSIDTLDKYREDLKAWFNTPPLSRGDLFLYGCNVAAGDAGEEFIAKLHKITGAEIAASTTRIGNAVKGGNWELDVSTGLDKLQLVFTKETQESYTGVLAVSNSTMTTPDSVFIGEKDVEFTVTFDNTGTIPGYGPFALVYLDTTGADGADFIDADGVNNVVIDDGLTFKSAKYLGENLIQKSYTFNSGGQAAVQIGEETVVVNAPPGFEPGDTVVYLELPFGSFVPDQPPADITVTVDVSDLADKDVPLNILSQTGYKFGDDPLDNADEDPIILENITGKANESIAPGLVKITKNYLGPEDETATGPNYVRQYQIVVDIAEGQTINNLDVTDLLPDTMQFVDVASIEIANSGGVNNGVVISAVSTPDDGGLTSIGSTNTTENDVGFDGNPTPGGILTRRFDSVTGGNGENDIVITVDFYVPRLDTQGDIIINADNGDDIFDRNQSQLGDNDTTDGNNIWVANDIRDGNLEVYIEAGDADNDTDHVLEEQSIAIQKSVANITDSANTPGDVLEYTLEFQVSDYFAFEDIIITDTFSDGQKFNTAFTPIVNITEQGGIPTGNLDFTFNNYIPSGVSNSLSGETLIIDETDIDNISDGSGNTVLTFRVSDELIASSLDGQLIGGAVPQGGFQDIADLNNNPPLPGGTTTGTITFQTIIQEEYADAFPSGDPSLDQGDRLENNAIIDGAVLNVLDPDNSNDPGTPDLLTPTGQREDDDTTAAITMEEGTLFKSIYAINGIVDPNAATDNDLSDGLDGYTSDVEVTQGDTVTYRLTYQLPTSDVEEFQFTDYFPLPVFDIGTEFASSIFSTTFDVTGVTIPAAGETHYGPLDTLHQIAGAPIPSLSLDAASNSLNYFYGDFDDPNNNASVVDLLVTVTTGNDPLADDLLLTNQVRESHENTFEEVSTRDAIVQITLREPELEITKGVVAHNSIRTDVEFSPDPASPSDVTFTPGSAPSFSGDGVVSSTDLDTTPIDSNLTGGLQVGDIVTFAIVVENVGGGRKGVFDAQIQDTLPDGFDISADGLNLNVKNGTGADLPFTGLGDPDGLGNDLFGNGIELSDPGATPSTGSGLTVETDAGGLDGFSETSGRNIAIISYDLQVNADSTYINPATIENTATVLNYSNFEGGENFLLNGEKLVDLSDNATVEIEQPEATKEIVATSEAHTPETGDGSDANPREATIGEIVRYRLVSRIPEGSAVDFVLRDNLPDGHTFLNDGTSTVAFVSNGTGVSSSTLGTAPANTGSATTDASNFVNLGDDAISSDPNSNTDTYNTGTDVYFKLGDIVNSDRDVDDEFIVIEFNALVDNNAVANTTNDAGDILTNNFQIIVDGTIFDTSNNMQVEVVEPQVEVDKLVKKSTSDSFADSINNIDAQDIVNYSVTFSNFASNGSVSNAYEVVMTDTLPEFLELQSIDSVTWNDGTTTGAGIGGTLNLVDSSDIANNEISFTANLLPQDGTVTINYTALVLPNVNPTFSLENSANVTYTSLPDGTGTTNNPTGSNLTGASGADNGERNGDDPGGIANDYNTSDIATVITSSFEPVKSIVATSESFTTDNNLTIGEIARYRLLVQIPEGSTNNLQITDLLPDGLRYLDDGTSKIALVSDGGLISDTITDSDPASPHLVSTDPAVTPEFDLTASDSGDANTTFESGEDPIFTLGNFTNTDSDDNSEYIAIEFNAIVENAAVNQDPGTLDNSFTVSGDSTESVASNVASINLVEPTINVLKTADIAQGDAGDTVTFTVTYTNAGNSTAFEVSLLDEPATANYTNIQIVDLTSNGTLSARTSNSTSTTINETLASVAVGETITLTYTAELATTLNPGDIADNTVDVTYSSLPGSGTDTNPTGSTPPDEERDGSDGVGGALNDYANGSTNNVTINSYSIGSTVFEDSNNNGLQDDGVTGISGVTVQLFNTVGPEIPVGADGILNTADDAVGGVVTDSNGNYFFGGLTTGDYQVVIPASNFNPSSPLETTPFSSSTTDTADNGEDGDDNGSQVDGLGTIVTSPTITLRSGDEPTTAETLADGNLDDGADDANGDMTVDFGFFGYGSFTGKVSEDIDSDPEGDAAISGVLLTLFDSDGNSIATTTTDDYGDYSFGNLLPGDYTIAKTQPEGLVRISETEGGDDNDPGNTTLDNTIAVTVTSGETDTGNDFVEGRLSLGSTIFVDINNNGLLDGYESGIENVTVQLFDTSGNEIPVGADGILGTDDDGIGGIVTDSDGNYFFDGLAPGDYQVVIPESNFVASAALENTPFSSTITDTADNGEDNDDNGIQTGGSGTEVTSPNINLAIGAETTTESGLGSTLDDLRNANGDLTVDFGFFSTAAITGNVGEDTTGDTTGDIAIEGVVLTLQDSSGASVATTTTNSNGDYTFNGVFPGNYTVVKTQPEAYFGVSENEGGTDNDPGNTTPDNTIAVTVNSGEADTGNDFVEGRLSLGSTIFSDINNNGLLDDGEAGVANVTVQLFDTSGNEILVGADGILGTSDDGVGGVVTDGNGNYFFDGLALGDYQVVIPKSNFLPNGALETIAFSSTTTDTLDNGEDGDNNGIQAGGAGNQVTSPNINLAIGAETHTESGVSGDQDNTRDANGDMTVDFGFFNLSNVDYGDAPDSLSGTLTAFSNFNRHGNEFADYQTRLEDGGAAHIIDNNLKLGNNLDAESGNFHNSLANADDFNGINDDDGVVFPSELDTYTVNNYSVTVDVTNNNPTEDATLIGWIDLDRDGIFATDEAVSQIIAAGSGQQITTLEWTDLSGVASGMTYARFRLSTDPAFDTIENSTSIGLVRDGEVEDYMICIAD